MILNIYNKLSYEEKITLCTLVNDEKIESIYNEDYIFNYYQLDKLDDLFRNQYKIGKSIKYILDIPDWKNCLRPKIFKEIEYFYEKNINNNFYIINYIFEYLNNEKSNYENKIKYLDILEKLIVSTINMDYENKEKILILLDSYLQYLTKEKSEYCIIFMYKNLLLSIKNFNSKTIFLNKIEDYIINNILKIDDENILTNLLSININKNIFLKKYFEQNVCKIFDSINKNILLNLVEKRLTELLNVDNGKIILNYLLVINKYNLIKKIDKKLFNKIFIKLIIDERITLNDLNESIENNNLIYILKNICNKDDILKINIQNDKYDYILKIYEKDLLNNICNENQASFNNQKLELIKKI